MTTSNKRGRPRRTWVKLHCDGILRGSINYQLTLAEQAVWMKMLALAAVCGGEDGWIHDNDRRPLPHFFIASELHCPVEILEETLRKCIEEGRCEENSAGIEIVNWKNYQSEYSRQKPSRDRRKNPAQKEFKECPECHYLVEISKVTENIEVCPLCEKKGKEVILAVKEAED